MKKDIQLNAAIFFHGVESLEEAYRKLHEIMVAHGYAWETSNEWYDCALEEPGDPRELQTVIEKVLKEKEGV